MTERIYNMSNEPLREECETVRTTIHRVSVVSLKDQGAFGVMFLCGSRDLKGLPWVPLGECVQNFTVYGGLLDRAPSRFDPKHGQWEVAGEFSEPDSEGTVFEPAGWSLSSPCRGWINRVTPCVVTKLTCGP